MKESKKWQKIKEKSENENLNMELDQVELQNAEQGDADSVGLDVQNKSLNYASHAELEEQLTLSEQKARENWDKATRIAAELENVRRRGQLDVENARLFGLEKFIASLLPVIDSLEQAYQLVDESTHQAMFQGLELTLKLFLDVLTKHNVVQIDPVGDKFDPHKHEAMLIQEADAVPNTVLTVLQKGYCLNNRIIRPARVIVAKAAQIN